MAVAGFGRAPEPTPRAIDWSRAIANELEDHTIVVYEWLHECDLMAEYATRRLAALDRLERALKLWENQ